VPLPSESPAYRDLSDWVVLRVLDAIRTGDIRPGDRLVEHDVAATFGVSRAPVRDGLHKLETIGVVERRLPRGVYVRSWTDQDATEVVELIDALILTSVQSGADRLTDEDLAKLEAYLNEAAAIASSDNDDPPRRQEIDLQFHLLIARAAGNRRVVQMMETLGIPLLLYAREAYSDPDGDHTNQIHWELLDALKRHDKAAAVAGVMRNAPKSKAVFARALHHHVDGQTAVPTAKPTIPRASPAGSVDRPGTARAEAGGRTRKVAR
jgi:DNA-binding GntR family transcriptional regulator